MAEKLSKLFGTEEDKVNCPFFYKMGACRHGAQCDRKHHHPLASPTIMVPHLFQNPMSAVVARGGTVSREEEAAMARDYEQTFIDIFDEVSRYGEVDEIQVCDNLNDHLVRWRGRGRAGAGAGAAQRWAAQGSVAHGDLGGGPPWPSRHNHFSLSLLSTAPTPRAGGQRVRQVL